MRFFSFPSRKRSQQNTASGTEKVSDLLSTLVETEDAVNQLPPLSPVNKAKFDHEIAIEHLYYSSKIEGTALTEKQIDRAIHGTTTLAAAK